MDTDILKSFTSLENDSLKIIKGSLYFAIPGLRFDGHDYIRDAIERGAKGIVHERELDEYQKDIFYLKKNNTRISMSAIADAYYDYPSRRMGIIGVTGTEGKSTTVYLIYQLLKLLGKRAGFISTVQYCDGIDEIWNSEHQTTPEAPVIHRLLAEMLKNGAEYAVVESSSHGLSKRTMRLGHVDFDVGVMTNVNHEHLEFHGTWEQYRSDKAELFRALDLSPSSHRKLGPKGDLAVPSFAVINADDKSKDYFSAAAKHNFLSFSTRGDDADLSIKNMQSESSGNTYELYDKLTGSCFTISDKLPGAFNAGNVLASLLVVSRLLPVELQKLIPLVPCLKAVRGRMNRIDRGQPFDVIVDYAHSPSSFEAVFVPLREKLKKTGAKLISLFGSAGERDTQKRPLQGEIAARNSDIVILCDEDPRGEDSQLILEEIAKGCLSCSHMLRDKSLFLIPKRPDAIRKAISLARPGDLVLLLGKGHENSIIYPGGPVAYDEISEAEKALDERGRFN